MRPDPRRALLVVDDLGALAAASARRALLETVDQLTRERFEIQVVVPGIESGDGMLSAAILALFLRFKRPSVPIELRADPNAVGEERFSAFEAARDKPARLVRTLDRMLFSRLHWQIGRRDDAAIAASEHQLRFIDTIADGDEQLARKLAKILNAQKRNLQLMVTRRCHLRCVYCPADKRDEDLELEHALRALELLTAGESESFRLDFAGGEPLLRTPWVRQVIEAAHARARAAGKRDSYYLVTNAIELTAEMSRFLAEYDLELEISIDGDEHSHNRNKVPLDKSINPYRTLLANFRNVRDLGIRYNAVVVFTPDTFATLRRDIEHVRSLGFANVSLNYALGYVWDPEMVERYVDLVVELVDRYDMLAENAQAPFAIKNLRYKSEPTVLNSELMVDTDGSLHLLSEWQFKKAFRQHLPTLRYRLEDLRSIDQVHFTKAEVYHLLWEVYRSPDARTLRIIHNNVETGLAVARSLERRLGQLTPD